MYDEPSCAFLLLSVRWTLNCSRAFVTSLSDPGPTMTDIPFNLNNSDLIIATSAARDDKDAGPQPWEYQVDNISTAGGLDSGTPSLHEGDIEERQVSAEPVSFFLVFRCAIAANILGEGVSRMGSTIVSLVESGALHGRTLRSILLNQAGVSIHRCGLR